MGYHVNGVQLRQSCPDLWREQLLTMMGIDEARGAVLEILRDSALRSEAQRVAAFGARRLGDRAT